MKIKTPLSHQRDKGVNLWGGPEGPTAASALCSKGIFPASSRPPCTKRRLSVRLGGGYLAFSAHSCDIPSYLIRFPAACQEFYCQFCAPGAYWPWRRGRAGEDTRPYEHTGSCPVNAVGAGDLGGPRAHNVRPNGGNRTGSVSSANPGAEMGPQPLKFLYAQARWADWNLDTHSDFARRKGRTTSKE